VTCGGRPRRGSNAGRAGRAEPLAKQTRLRAFQEDLVELLTWKLRVSMLWIFLGVGQLAAMFAAFLLPDVLDEVIATGEFEGMKIDNNLWALFMIVFTLLPLTMAFVTLALRDPINRYANAILGVLISVAWTIDAAEHLVGGEIGGGAVICGTMAIAGLLIVWHAWRWPAPAERSLPDRRPVGSPDQRAAKPV
jgi:hypothetical protein